MFKASIISLVVLPLTATCALAQAKNPVAPLLL